MHFAMILKCRFPDGRADCYVWMVDLGTQKQAEKYVTELFEKENVYGGIAPAGRPLAKLEEIVYFGETSSDNYEDTCALFEKAVKKAGSLMAKAAAKGAVEVKVEKMNEAVKEAV